MSLRVAIVGCGKMGWRHADALAATGSEIAFVSDVDTASAERLAAAHPGCRAAAPSELPLEHLDAVFVCTPPFVRGPVELAAIAAGVALFVEKPIARCASEARPIVEALRRRPVVNAVGYMHRQRPAVRAAVAAARAEGVVGVSCSWVGRPYRRDWWLAAETSGTPVNEQCTHLVDLCRHLAGEVVMVTATQHVARPDTMAIAIQFEGGACGTILYSYRSKSKDISIEVFTTSQRLRVDGEEDVFDRQAQAFVRAVAGVPRPDDIVCTFEDAFRSQVVVDTIVEALRSGRPQALDIVRKVSFD